MKFVSMQVFVLIMVSFFAVAATDSTTQMPYSNQDAVYLRPFLTSLSSSTTIGGYADANANYFRENGVSEGLSMEMRHFNIFVYSAISSRIKLLAELEFEHGTEEISLETAQLDFVLNSALVLRGGILLAPLGAYNQRHDSPLYEIIDRPLVSTQIIPSTLSLMGFGINGKFFLSQNDILTYDAYIANGLHDGIILNEAQRTLVALGKSNGLFEESNNGTPAVVSRVAFRRRNLLEIGVSAYAGTYNKYRTEGVVIDEKRSLHIVAIDYSLSLAGITLQGESAMNFIDVPLNLQDVYATKQWGSFLEAIIPLSTFSFAEYSAAVLNACLRLEKVDFNTGDFRTGGNIGDDVQGITAALSLRPTPTTVFRLNYQLRSSKDLLGNQTTKAGVQFGFATYF